MGILDRGLRASHRRRKVGETGLGVEKSHSAKNGQKNFCIGKPYKRLPIFLDIFYPQNFSCFGENGVLQQP